MVSPEEFESANLRAQELETHTPKAISARYDRRLRRIVVELNSNLGVFFSPKDAQGLETASAEELGEIELSPSGYGLHFPRLDADLYLPSLLEGVFGSAQWTAARMGARGGRTLSPAKAEAARANGRKGGRPRRAASV
ncbi:MAG: DUF2442 domain-containing protein [Acidobacteriaceae bacterium]|nr:DUF2442 domain-containing protein [Acidobacteriaceae bacterium]